TAPGNTQTANGNTRDRHNSQISDQVSRRKSLKEANTTSGVMVAITIPAITATRPVMYAAKLDAEGSLKNAIALCQRGSWALCLTPRCHSHSSISSLASDFKSP